MSTLPSITSTTFATATGSASGSLVTIFMPGGRGMGDDAPLKASVVGADSSKTTYAISQKCGITAKSQDGCHGGDCNVEDPTCYYGETFTMVEGPSTYELGAHTDQITINLACKIANDRAICTEFLAGGELESMYGSKGTTTTGTFSHISASSKYYYAPLLITAGTEKLSDHGSATATSSGSDASTASGTASVSGSSGTGVATAAAPGGRRIEGMTFLAAVAMGIVGLAAVL